MLGRFRARRELKRAAVRAAEDVHPVVSAARRDADRLIVDTERALAVLPGVEPRCPTCGGRMVVRRAKRKIYNGAEFWGCARYPACTGLQRLEDFPEAALRHSR
jgi:hypothetical protein